MIDREDIPFNDPASPSLTRRTPWPGHSVPRLGRSISRGVHYFSRFRRLAKVFLFAFLVALSIRLLLGFGDFLYSIPLFGKNNPTVSDKKPSVLTEGYGQTGSPRFKMMENAITQKDLKAIRTHINALYEEYSQLERIGKIPSIYKRNYAYWEGSARFLLGQYARMPVREGKIQAVGRNNEGNSENMFIQIEKTKYITWSSTIVYSIQKNSVILPNNIDSYYSGILERGRRVKVIFDSPRRYPSNVRRIFVLIV